MGSKRTPTPGPELEALNDLGTYTWELSSELTGVDDPAKMPEDRVRAHAEAGGKIMLIRGRLQQAQDLQERVSRARAVLAPYAAAEHHCGDGEDADCARCVADEILGVLGPF